MVEFSAEEEKEMLRDLKRYQSDGDYFRRNYETLKKDYPDQWVAVYNLTVIDHNRDFDKLLEELRKNGVDTGKVYLERTYFKEKRPNLLFAQMD